MLSFERFGQISLESLLKLALVLECLGEFGEICEVRVDMPKSMDELVEIDKKGRL